MNELVAFNVAGFLADLPYILAGIFALGVVVFVHEWGHFMAGRWAGIRPEAFSIGFGPILWRKTVGVTEYRVSAILFGGYVKYAGMEGTKDKTPQEVEGGFFAASPARRILAAFFGPLMNVALAFVLFFILWGTGRKVPEAMVSAVVGGFAQDSAAEAAGLEAGDRIVSISGRPVEEFNDIILAVAVGGETVDVAVERNGTVLHFDVTPTLDPAYGVRRLGVEPAQRMKVRKIFPDSVAEKMDLRKGDVLVRLDGTPVYGGESWQSGLRERAGKPIEITVERAGKELALTGTMPEGTEEEPPVLGFGMDFAYAWIYEQPLEAASRILGDMWRTLKALVSRRVAAKALSGPVGIVSGVTFSLRVSFTSFLWFAALISLNLAIINLLPIPVVDGGHIMFSLLEMARRKPMREKTMVVITNVFAVLIIAFFMYVTFNDIVRFWTPTEPDKEETQEQPAPSGPQDDAQPNTPGPDTGGSSRLLPGERELAPLAPGLYNAVVQRRSLVLGQQR
ncbi:MAG: RIP metalloprotease RseP [Verrucomicrobia bacterium]|nr:RIP metalloprotease RseP [Verrucomicrobiota bacterium]